MGQMTQLMKVDMYSKAKRSPSWFAEKVLGVIITDYQREILDSFVSNDKVAVKSGHALGKDFIAAILTLWFLCNFKDSIVITTAPSDRQVRQIMWGEIARLYNNSKYPLGGRLLEQEIKISDKWYAVGFTTKETNQTIGKFQGFHSKNILIIATEAQAIADVIFQQMEGLLTSDNSKLYVAGNPLGEVGEFYRIFNRNDYKKFTLSCYQSPNYLAQKDIISGLVSYKWIKDKEVKWGKDNPFFQMRVLGEFPKTSTSSLISISALRESVNNEHPADGITTMGIDVARFGDDNTSFAICKGGELIYIDQEQGKPTNSTKGKAVSLIKRFKPSKIVIDNSAISSGVIDYLEEDKETIQDEAGITFDIVPFNFGGTPTDRQFANRATEVYFKVCSDIEHGKVKLIEDEELFAQLSGRKYEFVSRGMTLESKDKIKARGICSPDKADALIMALSESIVDMTEESSDNSYLEITSNRETGYVSGYLGGLDE